LHLHLDPVSGIAGDMTVAALVDAGVPAVVVTEAVGAVGAPGLRVRFEVRRRGAFVGRGFVVSGPGIAKTGTSRQGRAARSMAHAHLEREDDAEDHGRHEHLHDHHHAPDHGHDHGDHPSPRAAAVGVMAPHEHRDYADIRRLLRRAKLDPDAKALAEEVFARLAEVEAALHGMPLDRVTFHEVGALDSIADIVGVSAAIAWLAPSSIGSSPPVVGTGSVRTAHGIVPVPAPATAALLQGVTIRAEGRGELTTPTGAAILASIVDHFGPPPPMRLRAVGYGAGTRELADRPNVLRVLLGEPVGRLLPPSADEVLLLEANIDDMSGQLLAALIEALFAAGALDAWAAPIVMKKGRPAHQVSALVDPSAAAAVERAFFLNSTTLGIRKQAVGRTTLARSVARVDTGHGEVQVKVAALDGEVIGAEPEFEDCRRRARVSGVPVRRVWTAASSAAAALLPRPPDQSRPPGGKRRRRARPSP
jgi:uncharacterized protein (TIGR00299 family) protein